jgi:hypothetical protein
MQFLILYKKDFAENKKLWITICEQLNVNPDTTTSVSFNYSNVKAWKEN